MLSYTLAYLILTSTMNQHSLDMASALLLLFYFWPSCGHVSSLQRSPVSLHPREMRIWQDEQEASKINSIGLSAVLRLVAGFLTCASALISAMNNSSNLQF